MFLQGSYTGLRAEGLFLGKSVSAILMVPRFLGNMSFPD